MSRTASEAYEKTEMKETLVREIKMAKMEPKTTPVLRGSLQ